MSALRQAEYYSPRLQPQQIAQQYPEIIKQPQVKSTKVLKTRSFTQSQTLPHNLKVLSLLQKGSFGIALVSLSVSIGLYISTVQIPKLWSQEYQNLEDLQRQERQLIAINETIKYQTAQAASQDKNLSISTPESAVFIPPAKITNKQESETAIAKRTLRVIAQQQTQTVKLKHNNLGY
jgi:hypothetical protein